MSALFEPLTLRSVTMKNRVWMPPMCQYCAASTGDDVATPNAWHYAHLGARAIGGAGLVVVEATAVRADGRISPGDLGLWDDGQIAPLARAATMLRELGSVPGIQLAHAGRKASISRPWEGSRGLPEDSRWPTVGPSGAAFGDLPAPEALSIDDMDEIVDAFVAATRRATVAGFEFLDIHGAHGYLLHAFLSATSNHRTDEFGGSTANRMRFPLRVVEAVRATWPESLPLAVRVSARDWVEAHADEANEGWTLDESVIFARELADRGVDLVDVSSGGIAPRLSIPVGPSYQVPLARTIKESVSELAVSAVGLITTAEEANETIESGGADAVFVGRAMLGDPFWARHAALALGDDPQWPASYDWCIGPHLANLPPRWG